MILMYTICIVFTHCSGLLDKPGQPAISEVGTQDCILGNFQPSPFGKLRAGSAGLNVERVVVTQTPKPLSGHQEVVTTADTLRSELLCSRSLEQLPPRV
jgi:hypothetical protein